jgi:hypothetical protein
MAHQTSRDCSDCKDKICFKPLTLHGDGSKAKPSFDYVQMFNVIDFVDCLHYTCLDECGYDVPVNLVNRQEFTVRNFAQHIERNQAFGEE